MRKLPCYIVLLVFLSCKNNKVPEDVLPEKKMQAVLWDMLRADEWATYEQERDTAFDRPARSKVLYQQVFQVNGITAAQFKKSFQFYQNHPNLLKPILDSLQKHGSNSPASSIR